MQKFILTIAILFALNATGFAATNFGLFFNDTRATEQARKMANNIQFNEMTYIQVKQLCNAKFKAIDQAGVQYSNDAAMKNAKIAEIENEFIKQVNALLNPIQQTSFHQFNNPEQPNLAILK